MYPFLVFDLPHEATDRQVERRYQELVERYPPDREPEMFVAIRQAYEALRDQRARLKTRLFYFDRHGRALREEALPRVPKEARRRMSAAELTQLVRQVDCERLAE